MINTSASDNQYYKHQRISFEGLKDNLRLGEKVLKDFRKEFGYPHSATFVRAKIIRNSKSTKPKVIEKLEEVEDVWIKYRNEVRELGIKENKRPTSMLDLKNYIDNLKALIKSKKCCNCPQQASIIQFELLKRGEEAHNVIFTFTGDYRNHICTVFGLKKGANFSNPATWGNKAVIVDAWSGVVKKANEGLEFLKHYMSFNSQKEKMICYKGDWFPVQPHLKDHLL